MGTSPVMRASLLVAVLLSAVAACAPLIRTGDIEPPPDTKVLVTMGVEPRRTATLPSSELAAAVGDASVAVLATTPQPKVSPSTALDEMSMGVQGLSVPAEQALVDEAELATDARRLESIYMARGFFRARSLGHRVELRGDDRAAVTFAIHEGHATNVVEIRFLGACEERSEGDRETLARLSELCRELRDLIPMRIGDVWTEEAYATGLDVVARAFRAAGFVHARVVGDNWVSRDRGEAAVWYEIDPGPLVRVVGEVIIEGNVKVDAERIRQRITIREGDVIDRELLRRNERDIQDLGPFFSVQASPLFEVAEPPPAPESAPDEPPADPADPADSPGDDEAPREELGDNDAPVVLPSEMRVRVQVAEAPGWELTVGPSVVTDFLRLDLALPSAFTHRNLFGEVVALQITARPALVLPDCFIGVGGCFANPEFGLDSKVGLQVPSFFEEYLRLAIETGYKRNPTQATKFDEVGGSVGLLRRIVGPLSARIGYNLTYNRYFGARSISDEAAAEAKVVSALRYEREDLLAWFDAALLLDLRDSPLDTRDGIFSALSINIAGSFAGSDATYTRLLGDVRLYWTPRFVKWLTLAGRLRVGWNFYDLDQGTPQGARFKSGGATSMRGFKTDRLGDFICAPREGADYHVNDPGCSDSAAQRTYIGGNHVIEANFELRFRMRGGAGIVLFVDAGRVWGREDDVDLGALFVALGPGFRYELPFGPLRIDLGFLLGVNPARAIHFSLGQAF